MYSSVFLRVFFQEVTEDKSALVIPGEVYKKILI